MERSAGELKGLFFLKVAVVPSYLKAIDKPDPFVLPAFFINLDSI